jgi:glycosyltransferase involved in cell wall biosynthesis
VGLQLRVCQFTPSLSGGGAEERIARVMASLDRRECALSWFGFGGVQHHITDRAGAGVTVVPFARDPTRGVESRLIVSIARELKRLDPHVLHTHNWSTSIYGITAARLAGVPAVIYGEGGRDRPEGPSRRRRALMRALGPHVDRFTAVCHFLGDELAAQWSVPHERVVVIPNGADFAQIDGATSREDARKRLGLPLDAIVIGSVAGRFRMVKRLPNLVDAVGLIAKDRPNVHLVLVGDPIGFENELWSRSRLRGLESRFHLPGHVEGVSSVLPAFDISVNCSAFEGASNAIIESMAARLAVVATAVGGTPELIRDGVSGRLVPPEDVRALADALAELCDREALRARFGEAGRKRIEEEHAHDTMVERYRRLYFEMESKGLSRTALRRIGDVGSSLLRIAEAGRERSMWK